MNVSLTPELEQIVREKLRRGDYDDANALVQEAVHRLIEEDEANSDALRATLAARDAEIDRGDALVLDEEATMRLASEVHERGLRRFAE